MIETLGALALIVAVCCAALALLGLVYSVIVNHDRRQQAEQRMYEAAVRRRNQEQAERVMTRSGALRAVDEGGSRRQRQDIDYVAAASAVLVNADYDYAGRHTTSDSSHSYSDHTSYDSGGSYDSGSSYSGGSDF